MGKPKEFEASKERFTAATETGFLGGDFQLKLFNLDAELELHLCGPASLVIYVRLPVVSQIRKREREKQRVRQGERGRRGMELTGLYLYCMQVQCSTVPRVPTYLHIYPVHGLDVQYLVQASL